jgi:beta-glucanase (GH16 family)
MPTAAPAGWSLAFSDDFSGHSLSGKWFSYDGKPSGDPGGYFASSHVIVGDGVLRLKGYRDRSLGGRWVTAGVQNVRSLRQTYGQYLVRFRIDNGQGIAYALLLWPASNHWPPEVDFAEDNGAVPRVSTLATIHYAGTNGAHEMIHRHTAVDTTQWHTLGVKWTPGRMTFTLDGTAWTTVDSSAVPTVPMDLAMQTQAWDCGHTWDQCPDRTTPAEVDMTVDWVVAYRRA